MPLPKIFWSKDCLISGRSNRLNFLKLIFGAVGPLLLSVSNRELARFPKNLGGLSRSGFLKDDEDDVNLVSCLRAGLIRSRNLLRLLEPKLVRESSLLDELPRSSSTLSGLIWMVTGLILEAAGRIRARSRNLCRGARDPTVSNSNSSISGSAAVVVSADVLPRSRLDVSLNPLRPKEDRLDKEIGDTDPRPMFSLCSSSLLRDRNRSNLLFNRARKSC